MAQKKTARKNPVQKKPTQKRTTRVRLVERAAPPAGSGGAVAIPGLEMGEIQDTVRGVVTYVQQNPLAAAAVAIGVGVMLTSMYWDNPTRGGKR